MKKILTMLVCAGAAWAQQSFDFSTLDKLGDKAKSKTVMTLDANTIRMAAGLLGGDSNDAPNHPKTNDIAQLISRLKGMTIRSYEFDAEGQYSAADLAPLRAWLGANPQWSKIVDVQEKKESSQVYVQALADGKLGGVAVISMEPRELTVLFITGAMAMEDIARLAEQAGVGIGLSGLSAIGQSTAKGQNKSK